LSDPEHPKETYHLHTGSQVNMVSQSWDGKRVYVTSSLLSQWDKTGADNQQFLRAFNWDGHQLTPTFAVDFTAEKLGRPHHMKFTAKPAPQVALASLEKGGH
jgi:selenium-binding protein 1